MPGTPTIDFLLPALTGLLAFAGTFAATVYARHKGMFDVPGDRHSHEVATPRGGGAGPVAALLLVTPWIFPGTPTATIWTECLLPGLLLLAVVGWWDDRVSLSAAPRFFVQVAVCAHLLWCAGFLLLLPPGWLLLLGLGLLWMTNLYNFMDGSNGMAGAQAVFAGSMLTWLFVRAGDPAGASLSLALALAALGFLPWNLGRARVFMGDVGSGALGYAIGVLLAWGWIEGAFPLPVAWMIMAVFVCDATLTLGVRVLKGERWYTPHKQHLYQRLIQCGWSHGRVLVLYQGINLVLVVPAVVVAGNWPDSAWVVASVTTLALVLGWVLVKSRLGVLAQAG